MDEPAAMEWSITPDLPDRPQLALQWNVSPLLAQILHNRRVRTAEQARAFLAPQFRELHEPATLPGMSAAAERLARAVRDREHIVIYGDYDVDGITGTAILWHLLTLAGAAVQPYVPHRLEEGYGLSSEALRQLRQRGANLVVSVDCGITAVEPAEVAAEIGLELIITDHHTTGPGLPACAHIVHPSACGPSPNPDLCGAGVALKLAWAVAQALSGGQRVAPQFRDFLISATGLAALGTIADVAALTGENRVIARFGLATLQRSQNPGVRALIESAGLAGQELDDYAVGFKLAPRLNAAGRLGHARLAVELLTRADDAKAQEIAAYLEHQNRRRQQVEREMVAQARELVHFHDMHRECCRAIVLDHGEWHAGVIGIVASRLVDEFHRPVVLISTQNGVGQGSARSVRHFALDEALAQCSTHLLSYGGHAMAAGLKIDHHQVASFREAFVACANNRLTAADLRPRLHLDAEVSLAELDQVTVSALRGLGPFGIGNPRPRLASRWLEVEGDPRLVGKSQDHLQFALREGSMWRKAIAFGQAPRLQPLRDARRCRVAFEPILNSFRGTDTVELQVVDMQFPS